MKATSHLVFVAAFCAAVGSTRSADSTGNDHKAPAAAVPGKAAPTFELPRLKANGRPGEASAVPRGRATVHALDAKDASARGQVERDLAFLSLDAGASWSSELRGGAKDITFVSFFVYASPGTAIDIAGARLVIRSSPTSDNVQLQIGRPGVKGMLWRDFGGPVRVESYKGAKLGALPVMTVRWDGAAGVWDLFVGGRLGAAELALTALPAGATKEFHLHAGSEGAFLCGLISSDDNPLFLDDNRNGIEDGFEAQQNGGALLNARGQARVQLARDWQQDQQARAVPTQSWAVQRPRPDHVPVKPAGK